MGMLSTNSILIIFNTILIEIAISEICLKSIRLTLFLNLFQSRLNNR